MINKWSKKREKRHRLRYIEIERGSEREKEREGGDKRKRKNIFREILWAFYAILGVDRMFGTI